MMKENSPICASPMPTRRATRLSCPARNAPKVPAADLTDDNDPGDNQNRPGGTSPGARDQSEGRWKRKTRAKHVADRLDERFDLTNLSSFRDDRADEKGPERDTVFEFDRQKRNAKAQARGP